MSYPWQIAIREQTGDRSVFCGGTILTSDWIITAAHCVYDLRSADEIMVTAGHTKSSRTEASREKNYQQRFVADIIVHRHWDEEEVVGDLAMLKLTKPFEFNPELRPICLPQNGFSISKELPVQNERNGPVCIITGWGMTQGTGDGNILQQATIPVLRLAIPITGIQLQLKLQ